MQSLLDWSVTLESSEYPAHQNELRRVLESLLAEAGNLLSLPSTHDYRQHSIITLSSTLKRKIQKLFGAFVALSSRGEEEDGDEEGDGGEGDGGKRGRTKLDKAVVVGERVKEVEKTAKDLQKEVYTYTHSSGLTLFLGVLIPAPLYLPTPSSAMR